MGRVAGHAWGLTPRGCGYYRDAEDLDEECAYLHYQDPAWTASFDSLRDADTRIQYPLVETFSQPPAARRTEPGFSPLLDMIPRARGHWRVGHLHTGQDLWKAIQHMPAAPGRVLSIGAPDMHEAIQEQHC